MTFLPEPAVLLAYSLACFVLFVTPGPDMSLFLAKTMAEGRRSGIAAMLGALTGCCVHTLLAALGISALLAASATAFTILKVVGALYLLWLAVDAVRNGSALNVKEGSRPPASFRRTFLLGIGVNLTNPKIVLFFVTFLPQFVAASDPHASAKLVFLGLYFIAFSAARRAAHLRGRKGGARPEEQPAHHARAGFRLRRALRRLCPEDSRDPGPLRREAAVSRCWAPRSSRP